MGSFKATHLYQPKQLSINKSHKENFPGLQVCVFFASTKKIPLLAASCGKCIAQNAATYSRDLSTVQGAQFEKLLMTKAPKYKENGGK